MGSSRNRCEAGAWLRMQLGLVGLKVCFIRVCSSSLVKSVILF